MPDVKRTLELGGEACRLTFDLDAGTFDVYSWDGVLFAGARPQVMIRRKRGLEEVRATDRWEVVHEAAGEAMLTAPGARGRLLFRVRRREGALLLWAGLASDAEQDGEPAEAELLAPLLVPAGGIWPGRESNRKWRFYLNGWQCWTPSGALKRKRSGGYMLPQFMPRALKPMLLNTATDVPSENGSFIGEWFGALADLEHEDSVVLGFIGVSRALSQVSVKLGRKPAQSRLEAGARLEGKPVAPGEELWSEPLAVITGDLSGENLETYAEMTAAEQGVRGVRQSPAAWCSWYQFFTGVTRADVERNLHLLSHEYAPLAVELVQIDDGYQPYVGDWLESNADFPGGMQSLAAEIESRGKLPGIWLAPFTAQRRSALFKEHRDWFIKRKRGRPVLAGVSPDWRGRFYGLDPTHPEVLAYLEEVFSTLREWGYRLFKLDFMACGMLEGSRHQAGVTRAEGLRHALTVIRRAAGDDAWLIAAGGPLLLGAGILDTQRIGADVAPVWRTRFQLLMRDRATPGARNCVFDTMTRAFMQGRLFEADPDCLMLRVADTKLTEPERRTLATAVAMLGGAFILSDDLALWGEEEGALAGRLLPQVKAMPRTPDLWRREMPRYMVSALADVAGEYRLVWVMNWVGGNKRYEVRLSELGVEPGRYQAHEFWRGRYLGEVTDAFEVELPAHGSAVVRLTPVNDAPRLVGSNVHITQGAAELRDFTVAQNRVSMTLSSPLECKAEVVVWVPAGSLEPAGADAEGIAVQRMGRSAFKLSFALAGTRTVELVWRR